MESTPLRPGAEDGGDPFRVLCESAFDAVIVTVEGRVCYANGSAARMLGLPEPEALLGTSPLDYVVPEHVERVYTALREDRREPYVADLVRVDGHRFTVEVHASVCTYEGQRARVAALRDVTEVQRAQAVVAERESQFRRLIEHAHDIIAVLDGEARIVFVSPSVTRLLGFTPDVMQHQNVFAYVHPDEQDALRAQLAALQADPGQPVTLTARVQHHSGGWRTLEAVCSVQDSAAAPFHLFINARDVTERIEGMERQQRREQLMARAEAIAHLGSFEWHPAEDAIVWSDELFRIFGLPVRETQSYDSLLLHIHPDDQPVFEAAVRASVATQTAFRLEYRIVRPDGTVRRVRTEGQFLAGGSTPVMVGTVLDITDQHDAQQRLRRSERLLAQAQEIARLGSYEWHIDAGTVTWSDQMYRHYGLEPGSPIALDDILARTHPDDVPVLTAAMEVERVQGFVDGFDFRIYRTDGAVRTLHVSSRVVERHGQRIAVGSALDVTEQRAAEAALRQRDALLRAVVAHLPVALFVVDTAGRLSLVEGQGLQHFETVPGAWVGDAAHERLAAYPGVPMALAAASTGTSTRYQIDLDDAVLEWFCTPLLGGDAVTGTLALAVDVTDLKRSEEAVRASMERLRQLSAHMESVREEERTRIAREVHDVLGQALTALRMDVVWIQKQLPEAPPPVLERFEGTRQTIDETIKTVRRIASDLRPSILDHFGLAAALEWQLQEFSRRTGLAGTFKDTSDGLADALPRDASTALFRVFQEALTNVARHAEAQQVVGSLSQSPDGRLCLRVADDGRGIRPESLAQTQSLGLLGMRERVLQWGGEVEVAGQPDAGTTVTIVLPLPAQG